MGHSVTGDKLQFVERGRIYKWQMKDDSLPRRVLVVSNERRGRDNLISVLFLSDCRGPAEDCVMLPQFWDKTDGIVCVANQCVHTDLVTYTQRSYIIDYVATVSQDFMDYVDNGIYVSLGLKQSEALKALNAWDKLVKEGYLAGISTQIQTEDI